MDAIGSLLTAQILKALGEGQFKDTVFLVAIFFLLWVQLRGLKKEIHKLGATIGEGFAKGESRFQNIEQTQLKFEHRLTLLEPKTN